MCHSLSHSSPFPQSTHSGRASSAASERLLCWLSYLILFYLATPSRGGECLGPSTSGPLVAALSSWRCVRAFVASVFVLLSGPCLKKILAPIKTKSALPPLSKNPKNQNTKPPKTRNFMGMEVFLKKERNFSRRA